MYVCTYVSTHTPQARHCCSACNISARSIQLAALPTVRSLPCFNCYIQHNTTQHNTTQHNTTQHNTIQHNYCIGLSNGTPCLLTHVTLQFSLFQYSGFQSVAKCRHLLELCSGLLERSTYKRHFSHTHRWWPADQSETSSSTRTGSHAAYSLQSTLYIVYKQPPSRLVAAYKLLTNDPSCTDSQYKRNKTLLDLRRTRTGTVWFYSSTSNKRAARPKLYTESLTRDLKRVYSRLTLVRISINL